MEKNAYNIEVFKSLREEIHRRIDIHYRIILTKYVLVGGLFAYLLTHAAELRTGVSPFLVASALSFSLDIVILENLGWIRTAGSFIRNNIETSDLAIVKWETRAAQPGNRWTCFTVAGYILGTWSIGIIFLLGAILVDRDLSIEGIFGVVVTLYLLSYSLYLVTKHLGQRAASADRRPSPLIDLELPSEIN
jgi:hypothetical protein